MSSLWTPDGERPIRREAPGSSLDTDGLGLSADGQEPSPEEVAALQEELAAMSAELAQVPAYAIVANHCIGLFQLAAVHLQSAPPNLGDAQLSIDAMAAIVEGLKGRLGPDEDTLQDALAQIRLAFVQVKTGMS